MTETIRFGELPAPVDATPADPEMPEDPDIVPAEPLGTTIEELALEIRTLTKAVRIIGAQQQWVTDTIAGMQQQFAGMMAGGNPLKMLGQFFNAGKGGHNG